MTDTSKAPLCWQGTHHLAQPLKQPSAISILAQSGTTQTTRVLPNI
eukprot:CAMPEP_0204266618 /NCGR_PEP_ID=MMETSP0468-20130131/10435_1 /ASSEMBLY_ACC=CAM_ASM_000383 /TAXON_ID=2969 /ORGANISM="Oxyrrhis marina" /LENGTH=45 /DNA_ID= /DNA_START= /DNA_END= /DNA_ORIENTATION=